MQYKIRLAGFVPVMIQSLVDASRETPLRFKSLDTIIYGGAAIPKELQAAVAEVIDNLSQKPLGDLMVPVFKFLHGYLVDPE